ncbi:MAG: EAL domain-containing protein [Nocardioidaceae bacterium]|nr:EAL domain-containing protein [Nocardioidaceae bacterium]
MDHQAVNRAIARLSLVATEDVPARVTLRELCDVAAGVLSADGVGVMITDEDQNRFVHATSDAAADLERLQESLRAGPCRDAAETGTLQLAHDLATFEAWPQFADLAADLGITAVAAVPLMSRGRCWGVLDVYRRESGDWDPEVLDIAALLADVATTHLVMAADRDASRLAQVQLSHQSSHDHLTGLANRVLLFDRLEHALALAPRRGTGVGVLFIDLDGFKQINDTYGHRTGDYVLREVSLRLSSVLRSGDTLARLSGDEFVVICDDLPLETPDEPSRVVAQIAERVHQVLATGIEVTSGDVSVSASVGAAIATGGMSAEELVGEADAAMYRAKQPPPTPVEIRDYTGSQTLRDERAYEHDLAHALERDQLVVHYQPIVDATPPHPVVAVEALLRWRDDAGHLIPARAFIDLATERGLMPAFGTWVVNEVCAQMERWNDGLGDAAPAIAYVNLSAREINDPHLPGVLAAALRRHHLLPGQLGLEIVEDSFVHPGLVVRLENLRARGHRLSIDDFGTGYSSLSRLFDLQVDVAKIDHTFVAGTPADLRRTGFVNAVLSITRSLSIDVVAEGVETVEQQQFLTAAGCDMLQGYLFGRPDAPEELTVRLLPR